MALAQTRNPNHPVEANLEQLGQALGVSKGRVSQLERRGANLESATLARVAKMLGYDASIVFRPRDTKRRTLEALLTQTE